MNVKQIKNLLEKTSIIKKKYDDLAEYTGENFNVFNILGLDEKELIHSSFIANLLNVRAGHGQKDVFLKLFIEEIKDLFFEDETNRKTLEEFESFKSSTLLEDYIGRVDYERGEGGRIDIVIKDEISQILIENKIGAGDQEVQLLRYNNAYPNAPIIYLTPFGSSPSDDSKEKLIENRDFICISYEQHIVSWIEKCVKEMANKPLIRETLNQYLHLVKQITNQTINDKMGEEIHQIILRNYTESSLIYENLPKAIFNICNNVINKLEEKLKEYLLDFEWEILYKHEVFGESDRGKIFIKPKNIKTESGFGIEEFNPLAKNFNFGHRIFYGIYNEENDDSFISQAKGINKNNGSALWINYEFPKSELFNFDKSTKSHIPKLMRQDQQEEFVEEIFLNFKRYFEKNQKEYLEFLKSNQ